DVEGRPGERCGNGAVDAVAAGRKQGRRSDSTAGIDDCTQPLTDALRSIGGCLHADKRLCQGGESVPSGCGAGSFGAEPPARVGADAALGRKISGSALGVPEAGGGDAGRLGQLSPALANLPRTAPTGYGGRQLDEGQAVCAGEPGRVVQRGDCLRVAGAI